ncbi:hypothetical protein GDO78_008785 [Eleutherodactylus coqui]|uniref:Uncharacterized protein n=1 Tax=Eleutherodactylus coqui TaxID=57060 RepID=A0A8J6KAK2_ELECQ|nr:hypothetical protein GDO78_008785 [Eleutherodactylus coqui]
MATQTKTEQCLLTGPLFPLSPAIKNLYYMFEQIPIKEKKLQKKESQQHNMGFSKLRVQKLHFFWSVGSLVRIYVFFSFLFFFILTF